MNGADVRGMNATASNGTHRAAKKNRAAKKRYAGSSAADDPQPAQPPAAAEFVVSGTEPIDALMWAHHPAAWFQPELQPSVAVWSGLTIERRHRVPAPDFVHFDPAPADRPQALDSSREMRAPDESCAMPQSRLAPLGWDPRAVCRKGGGE